MNVDQTSLSKGRVEQSRPLPALRNRNFAYLFSGQLISNIGDSFYRLSVLWLIKEITGSATMMGTVMIATLLPMVLLGPFAGVVADRFDKRRLMMASDLVSATVVALLFVLFFSESLLPWHVLLASALLSASVAFLNPAKQGIVVHLVPKASLTQANSYLQSTFQFSQLAGPVLAGILIGAFGVGPAIAIDGISFLLSAALLSMIRVATVSPEHRAKCREPFFHQMREGFTALRSIPAVFAGFPLVIILNLAFAPILVLLPLFVDLITTMGATGLGILQGAVGGGMLAGSLLVGAWGNRFQKGRLILGALLLSGLLYLAFALSHTLIHAAVLFALMGIALPAVNIPVMTLIQERTPPEQHGRIFSLVYTGSNAAQPLGSGLAGFMADAYGVRALLVAGSCLMIATTLAATAIRPIRQAE